MAHYFSFATFLTSPKTAILFLFITYLISNPLYAQKATQDSLEQVLDKRNLAVEERILTISRLATHYYFNGDKEKSTTLLDEASQLANALEDKQYLARVLAAQAMQLRIQGDSTASTILQSALDNLHENADPSGKGYVWYAKGWMESRDDQPTEAVASLVKA